MSTALYRRYRPETFADVIGQEHVTEPLMTALRKNRVNHAYLFSGPRGCGKTTSARILARCLNCAEGPTPTPCGTCSSCQDLARDGAGSLDVIEMDAASHGGVDHARDLRERATFAPVRDRYKIFIIDEAHMVTREGFNALLKIVEEPPEHIKFIFATTEPNKVLGTIRSRTHHYPFRLVAPEVLRGYLQELCQKESIAVEQGVLPLVVRAGGGSVRDSLSVLDQLMAGAGQEGITYDLAVALLGFTHAELLDGVVDAFAAGDAPAVFQAVDRVIQTGQDPRRFVEDLLERFRDLIIVKAVPDSAGSVLHGMPEDQLERMRGQAQQLGSAELSRSADITNQALTEMTGATSPQLHLELLCARILLPTAEDSTRGVGARVDRLERRINLGTVGAVPAPLQQDPAAVTTPETPAEHAAAQADAGSLPAGPPAQGKEAALAQIRRSREQLRQPETDQQEPAVPAPAAGQQPERPPRSGQAGPGEAGEPPHGADQQAPGQSTSDQKAPHKPAEEPQESHRPERDAAYSAQPTAAPDAGQVNMISRSWEDVVSAVGKRSKVAQATFRECRPARFENGVLYVSSTGPGIQSRVQRYAEALAQALQETLGVSCAVALDGADGPEGGGSGPAGGPGPGGGSGPGGSGPDSSAPGGPRSRGAGSGSRPTRGGRPEAGPRAPEEEPWPGQDQWDQAARRQESAADSTTAPSGSATAPSAPSTRPSQRAASRTGAPALPQEGTAQDQQAWQQHGQPLQESPDWSADEDGEDFTGWSVAAIPEDQPSAQPQVVPEQPAPHQSASHKPAPQQSGAQQSASPAPAPRQPSEAPGSAHPSTGSHLHVVRDAEAEAALQNGSAGTAGQATDQPAERPEDQAGDRAPVRPQTENQNDGQDQGQSMPSAQDTSGAQAPEHPADAAASSAEDPAADPEQEPCHHDWSVTARAAGAPGHPVDGKGSGWGYAGPDGDAGPGAEHPARWGQRTGRLSDASESATAEGPSGPSASPAGQQEQRSASAPGQDSPTEAETARRLHAVPSAPEPQDLEEPDDLEYEESWAPQDSGYPTGPAVLEDETPAEAPTGPAAAAPAEAPTHAPADAPAARTGRALSFRERHAAEIAKGASARTAGTAPAGDSTSEEDWENFVPAPDDEDIEGSAAFGKAAVETILGGRVIEERPHRPQA